MYIGSYSSFGFVPFQLYIYFPLCLVCRCYALKLKGTQLMRNYEKKVIMFSSNDSLCVFCVFFAFISFRFVTLCDTFFFSGLFYLHQICPWVYGCLLVSSIRVKRRSKHLHRSKFSLKIQIKMKQLRFLFLEYLAIKNTNWQHN